MRDIENGKNATKINAIMAKTMAEHPQFHKKAHMELMMKGTMTTTNDKDK